MGFDIHKIIGKYGCERVCKNPMARYVPLLQNNPEISSSSLLGVISI